MTAAPERPWLTEHGQLAAPRSEILRSVVGSGVHGIAIEGTDDHDEMGVFVEPAESVLGVHWDAGSGHYIARTVPEGHRSNHGDTDLSLFSLRKYVGLVAAGNPTALLPLFAPRADVLVLTPLGEELRAFGPSLLSQQAGWRFLGYMREQRERLTGGGRRGKVPARPELVAAHGFDTKYAAHALRLAIQGLEVARHGRLTLPLPSADREMVLAVKRGESTIEDVLALIDRRGEELESLLLAGRSPLPERPDVEAANRWLVRAHLTYWRTPPVTR